jgi:hypothetical protein
MEHSGGGMSALSGVANWLPTSVVTSAARATAGKIDFATSNLRGAPMPLYVSGARVLRIVTMGPVAGTACNATALSYENSFDIGLFIDPTAIESPATSATPSTRPSAICSRSRTTRCTSVSCGVPGQVDGGLHRRIGGVGRTRHRRRSHVGGS